MKIARLTFVLGKSRSAPRFSVFRNAKLNVFFCKDGLADHFYIGRAKAFRLCMVSDLKNIPEPVFRRKLHRVARDRGMYWNAYTRRNSGGAEYDGTFIPNRLASWAKDKLGQTDILYFWLERVK